MIQITRNEPWQPLGQALFWEPRSNWGGTRVGTVWKPASRGRSRQTWNLWSCHFYAITSSHLKGSPVQRKSLCWLSSHSAPCNSGDEQKVACDDCFEHLSLTLLKKQFPPASSSSVHLLVRICLLSFQSHHYFLGALHRKSWPFIFDTWIGIAMPFVESETERKRKKHWDSSLRQIFAACLKPTEWGRGLAGVKELRAPAEAVAGRRSVTALRSLPNPDAGASCLSNPIHLASLVLNLWWVGKSLGWCSHFHYL